MANPNDPIRAALVQFMYDVHTRTVHSENGQVTGTVLVSEVRKRTGLDANLLGANLDYLVGSGHVEHILQPIFHDGKAVPGIGKHFYRITIKGIDTVEGRSEFMTKPDEPRIAITTKNGVTIVGSNNIVNYQQNEASALLRELATLVRDSKVLEPEIKADVTGDIETIESQLKKTKPSRDILHAAWTGIERTVTGAEFAEVLAKIAAFIQALL